MCFTVPKTLNRDTVLSEGKYTSTIWYLAACYYFAQKILFYFLISVLNVSKFQSKFLASNNITVFEQKKFPIFLFKKNNSNKT